jgi:adenylate cyclase
MKRIYYVSRFSRPLSLEDLDSIQESSLRNNPRWDITGFLVCLGDTFFQVLEGPSAVVDQLYYERIIPDERHTDTLCLKSETDVSERMFPDWHMKTFNLNEQAESLPFSFRQVLTALLESHHTIAQYTQPSVLKMLEHGINPATVRPRRVCVTVLYSDIIGFSRFAEHLDAEDLIDLANSHSEVCSQKVISHHGQVNKLTGDGVLAYFTGLTSDDAIEAAAQILQEMAHRRKTVDQDSPQRHLYGGVGLAHGLVYEGNVGSDLKRDFTILGNTVNLAARIESMTRDLDVRINLDNSVVRSAKRPHPFQSLGKHLLKGQSQELELFTLGSLPPLQIRDVYQEIEEFVTR